MAIKVYTTPTCKWCNLLKEYLDSKNIDYEDINVAMDRFSALDMIRRSGQSAVPVIEINGNIVVGFDKEKVDELLVEQLILRQ